MGYKYAEELKKQGVFGAYIFFQHIWMIYDDIIYND